MRSKAPSASSTRSSKTPAAIHSSRRARSVVSVTAQPNRRSAVWLEQPVTNRTRIPSKHTRSGTRRRCVPNGWESGRCGNNASAAAHTASFTS